MKSDIINEKTSITLNSHLGKPDESPLLKSLKIKFNEEHIYEALDLDSKNQI